MTEKQYENLMRALCTIIALQKRQWPMHQAISGTNAGELAKIGKAKLEMETEEVYQDLISSPLNRGTKDENN